MTNDTLDAAVANVPESERIEISQKSLLLTAVKDFYFAKYFHQKVSSANYEDDDRLEETFIYLSRQLLKQAVISVATTIDLTCGRGPDKKQLPGRTASLPHLLERITKSLEDHGTNVDAELDLVEGLRKAVNTQAHPALEYVQYMRNKWAGHSSMDRKFDTWAQASESLNILAVEAALVRVVNAYEDFSDLVVMSDALSEKAKKPKPQSSINADGYETWAMTVDWSSIRTFAPLQRESARQEVDHFFETLSRSAD